MKFIAYILSFYILFLAMAPGVNAMYAGISKQEQKMDCCGKCNSNKEDGSSQKEKSSSNKNTSTDNCNPLEACSACSGYTVNISPIISILPVFYADKPSAAVQDKLLSNFSFDFWQPPRLS